MQWSVLIRLHSRQKLQGKIKTFTVSLRFQTVRVKLQILRKIVHMTPHGSSSIYILSGHLQ